MSSLSRFLMCDIQSSVIHSSTASLHPHQELTPGSLWDLASSELSWGAMPGYQAHPLWEAGASHAAHPAQYQPELFGFGAEFWGGGGGKGGVPPHLVPGSRYEEQRKAQGLGTFPKKKQLNYGLLLNQV